MYQKEDRYKSNENNKKIFKVKAKLVICMWLVFFKISVEQFKYFIYSSSNTAI